MPQLNKSLNRATRNVSPCCVRGCGKDHETWQHGKTPEQIEETLESRRKNPRDILGGGFAIVGTATGRISSPANRFNLKEIERKPVLS